MLTETLHKMLSVIAGTAHSGEACLLLVLVTPGFYGLRNKMSLIIRESKQLKLFFLSLPVHVATTTEEW